MNRTITKIGDIFTVDLDNSNKGYFQYVANDLTQLNSSVIRVFKKTYNKNQVPQTLDIVQDDINFYAHTILRIGIKHKYWTKIGKGPIIGDIDVIFRGSKDVGNLSVKPSENWYIWRINSEFKDIGKLTEQYYKAEIGSVIPPDSIVNRIKTGRYDFVYPIF